MPTGPVSVDTVGVKLAQGAKLEELTAGKTVEGVATASVAVHLADLCGLELPIFRAVAAVLEGKITIEVPHILFVVLVVIVGFLPLLLYTLESYVASSIQVLFVCVLCFDYLSITMCTYRRQNLLYWTDPSWRNIQYSE